MLEKIFLSVLTLLLIICAFSCNGPNGPSENKINPSIIEIMDCCGEGSSDYVIDYRMAVWRGNRLFGLTKYFQIIELGNDLQTLSDTIYTQDYHNWTFIETNRTGDKFLLVESNYLDVSLGTLYELDLITGELTLLRDGTLNVSSALYWHGDDNRVIYYRYGDPVGQNPGYYLFNKSSQKDSLLFEYLSPLGPSETVNCFDLHPANESILIGAVQSTPLNGVPPKLLSYNLSNGIIDTLNIEFDFSFNRVGLWVRYNGSGDKILYCTYPRNVYGVVTNDNGEIGIIDLPSFALSILDVNISPNKTLGSIPFAPRWSPDEQSIVFVSGRLSIEGARGFASLYILKNFN